MVLVALFAVAASACAVVSGLDNYENVDCVGDGCEAGSGADGSTDASFPTSDTSTAMGDAVAVDARGVEGASADCNPACAGNTPICNAGTHTCVGCLNDSECKDPLNSRCDLASSTCVACLPQNDNCPNGHFCEKTGATAYECLLGCTTTPDCFAKPDGGAADGGDAGDAGAADGGSISCCNHRCVDTTHDVSNCGVCGTACKAAVDGGVPACCGSSCVDTSVSAPNCGACGSVCSSNHVATPACAVASCSGACDVGFADCNKNKLADGCEINTAGDPQNCGACASPCSANHITTPTCGSGTCNGTCDPGFVDCNTNKRADGCEINTPNDPANCGSCGAVCSSNHVTTPTCAGSFCNGACAAGYTDCNLNKLVDGCEINTSSDPLHCGGCFNVCSTNNVPTPTCTGNACSGTCAVGFADCNVNKLSDGCEADIVGNPNTCGSCTRSCSSNNMATRTCTAGNCSGTCAAGFLDCNNNKLTDGCEVSGLTDPNNCGLCGKICGAATPSCSNGVCVVASTCNAATEVTFGGKCYYLDGSGGVCDAGYSRASNAQLAAVLAANASAWVGKTYKHGVSTNCCVWTSDATENYGMVPSQCDIAGTFSAATPALGGDGCSGVMNFNAGQLTACVSN